MYYKENELTLIYNKKKELDRKTLAMAHAVTQKINRQEINSTRISETLFHVFIDKLGKSPKELFDKSQPYYQKELRGKEFSNYGWYNVLMHHPELLKAPLAMLHGKAIICTASNDVLKLH